MKHYSLKLIRSLVLTLGLSGFVNTAFIQSAPRTFSTDESQFISGHINKITRIVEKIEHQIGQFLDMSNKETIAMHVAELDYLLVEIRSDLIDPLAPHQDEHESFKLAHDILIDVESALREFHSTLKKHQSSYFIILGQALKSVVEKFKVKFGIIEKKIDSLTIAIETIACNETHCLKKVIINLSRGPLAAADENTILRCLKFRVNCK